MIIEGETGFADFERDVFDELHQRSEPIAISYWNQDHQKETIHLSNNPSKVTEISVSHWLFDELTKRSENASNSTIQRSYLGPTGTPNGWLVTWFGIPCESDSSLTGMQAKLLPEK